MCPAGAPRRAFHVRRLLARNRIDPVSDGLNSMPVFRPQPDIATIHAPGLPVSALYFQGRSRVGAGVSPQFAGVGRPVPSFRVPFRAPSHAPIDETPFGPYLLRQTRHATAGARTAGVSPMKVRNSLKSLRSRHRNNQLVRRRGRVYVINKTQRRFKARQG